MNASLASAGPEASRLFIREYRIEGARTLPRLMVEAAVYPFLGPDRTADDVERARAALEAAYRSSGYQTVVVQIPAQSVQGGVVRLQVVEGAVGRLRVRGSRYFLPDRIKAAAPSMAEGGVPEFGAVQRDLVALNRSPDLRVAPDLRPGVQPGTVDIDLKVEDHSPLHGGLELNNHQSPNTTALRLDGHVSYANLWQRGHTLGASFEVAPERSRDSEVFSGFYQMPLSGADGASLLLQGSKQDSDVAAAGGVDSLGRGHSLGVHLVLPLPPGRDFSDSVSLGLDYKRADNRTRIGGTELTKPVTYFPFGATYSASWLQRGKRANGEETTVSTTDANLSANLAFRGAGSRQSRFDENRAGADGGFLYFRADLTHTRELPAGFQACGSVQGQLSPDPLIQNEQFSAGGAATVRGYYEAEASADSGIVGSLELRSPPLPGWPDPKGSERRAYLFLEGASLSNHDVLTGERSHFRLGSYGAGARLRIGSHFSGALDLAVPLLTETYTEAHDVRLLFRASADY